MKAICIKEAFEILIDGDFIYSDNGGNNHKCILSGVRQIETFEKLHLISDKQLYKKVD